MNFEVKPTLKQFNPFTLTADETKQICILARDNDVSNTSINHKNNSPVDNLAYDRLSNNQNKDYYAEDTTPPFSKENNTVSDRDDNKNINEGYMELIKEFTPSKKEKIGAKHYNFTDDVDNNYNADISALDVDFLSNSTQATQNINNLNDNDCDESFLDEEKADIRKFYSDSATLNAPQPNSESREFIEHKVLGEIFDCFIICETANELILVDKHATHERHLYNKIKQDIDSNSRQLVLTNNVVLLRGDDYRTIIGNPKILAELGIVFRDIGDGAIIIEELALVLVYFYIQSILEDTAQHIRQDPVEITPYLRDEFFF